MERDSGLSRLQILINPIAGSGGWGRGTLVGLLQGSGGGLCKRDSGIINVLGNSGCRGGSQSPSVQETWNLL